MRILLFITFLQLLSPPINIMANFAFEPWSIQSSVLFLTQPPPLPSAERKLFYTFAAVTRHAIFQKQIFHLGISLKCLARQWKARLLCLTRTSRFTILLLSGSFIL